MKDLSVTRLVVLYYKYYDLMEIHDSEINDYEEGTDEYYENLDSSDYFIDRCFEIEEELSDRYKEGKISRYYINKYGYKLGDIISVDFDDT